jgi:GNAT superfamily N-acetyltransferase
MLYEEAHVADISQLCALLEQLFSQEAEFIPDAALQAKALKAILTNTQTGKIFVAKEKEKIVGMVSILFSISTALGGRVGMLEDMVVDKNHRGKNIGTELIEFALDCVKEQGCQRVTLLTDGTNRHAHHFYAKQGFFQSDMLPFRKLL